MAHVSVKGLLEFMGVKWKNEKRGNGALMIYLEKEGKLFLIFENVLFIFISG